MIKARSVLLVSLLLCSTVTAARAADVAGGVQPATMEKYQKARERVEALKGTPAATYAPEVVADAGKSLASAQAGLKAGSDQSTREAVEMALLQTTLAGVLAEERAAAERTVAARSELEKLEQRLGAILAGKGGQQ